MRRTLLGQSTQRRPGACDVAMGVFGSRKLIPCMRERHSRTSSNLVCSRAVPTPLNKLANAIEQKLKQIMGNS